MATMIEQTITRGDGSTYVERRQQCVIKVHLADGDYFTTSINGTEAEIRAYYRGQSLNMGIEDDRMVKVSRIEFIDGETETD